MVSVFGEPLELNCSCRESSEERELPQGRGEPLFELG